MSRPALTSLQYLRKCAPLTPMSGVAAVGEGTGPEFVAIGIRRAVRPQFSEPREITNRMRGVVSPCRPRYPADGSTLLRDETSAVTIACVCGHADETGVGAEEEAKEPTNALIPPCQNFDRTQEWRRVRPPNVFRFERRICRFLPCYASDRPLETFVSDHPPVTCFS